MKRGSIKFPRNQFDFRIAEPMGMRIRIHSVEKKFNLAGKMKMIIILHVLRHKEHVREHKNKAHFAN
jgi:hypothetical protein